MAGAESDLAGFARTDLGKTQGISLPIDSLANIHSQQAIQHADSSTPRQPIKTPTQQQKSQSLLNMIGNDIVKPLINSAIIEPSNTVVHIVNVLAKPFNSCDIWKESKPLKVEAVTPDGAEQALQAVSSGIGAFVPYTIAGQAMIGTMRGLDSGLKAGGLMSYLLRSESSAYVTGAFLYDGLRTPQKDESRLGNALGGAAGFFAFELGNNWTRGLGLFDRLASRTAVGLAGGAAQATASTLWNRHDLPTGEELTHAAFGGATLNLGVGTAQDGIGHLIVDWQSQRQGGVPVDRYIRYNHSDRVLQKVPELSTLIYDNPRARVRIGQPYANFHADINTFDLRRGTETPGTLARGLGYLRDTHAQVFETSYQRATSLLQQGKIADSWQLFHDTRSTQDTSAHQEENVVNHRLNGTTRLPAKHMSLEIGAWPAPGGVSNEARWRQEFTQFMHSSGKWRPGDHLATTEQFHPNQTEGKHQERSLTVEQLKAREMKQAGTVIIRELQQAGHIGAFVGGSVRDEILGLIPKDYDIATSARPEEVKKLFQSKGYTVTVRGKRFPLTVVVANDFAFEIATLRNDSKNNGPNNVPYGFSLYEDSARRDLTINSIFSDPTTGVAYDFHGGLTDIAGKRLRGVGNPNERFAEDPLRMTRIPRFASRFKDFTIEPATLDAMTANADKIGHVHMERMKDELLGILKIDYPNIGLNIMMDTGLMHQVLPEVAALTGPKAMQDPVHHPEGTVWAHTLMLLDVLRGASAELKLAALLHDIGKPATQKILENGRITNLRHEYVGAKMTAQIADRLKLPKDLKRRIVKVDADHMKMHSVRKWRGSTLRELLASPYFYDHVELQHADATGRGHHDNAVGSQRDWLLAKKAKFVEQPHCEPIVDGRLLLDFGLKDGARFGLIKREALKAQQTGTFVDRESALAWLQANIPEIQKSGGTNG